MVTIGCETDAVLNEIPEREIAGAELASAPEIPTGTAGHQQIPTLADLVEEVEPSVTSIFVLPPSRSALVERLLARGKDSSEEIQRRTNLAVDEISHFDEFDYVLVNDDFDEALVELTNIISSVRNGKLLPKSQVADLVARLLSDKSRFE